MQNGQYRANETWKALQSLLDDLDRVPLSEKAPIFNENPPIVGRPQDSGTRRTLYGNYGGANHHRHNPHKLHDLPVLKRVADRVLETAKKTVVGGVGWSCTILDMAEISSYDHTPQHLHRDAPPYTIPEGTLIVNCLIMLTHNHEEEDGSHFLFVPSSSSGFPDPWVESWVQFSSIPTEYRHGPYKRRLKNCFKGWSLVRPSMSLRHMHHCMSMNALEQGLLGLEATKASDIDDFV